MEWALNYNAHLLSLARWAVHPGENGVDFGAGRGTFALPMHHSGRRIACVEPDPASRTLLSSHGIKTCGRLVELPSDHFEGAWSFNVLEHIDDDAGALHELRRILRPGGRLAIYVPAFPILFSAMDRHVGHRRRYRRKPLTSLVEQVGFRIERSRYADCIGFPAALAFRLVGPRHGQLNTASVRRYDRFVFPASKALDLLFSHVLGKNLVIQARRVL